MVKTSLVESEIEEGKKLLDELKKIDTGFPVRSAFWFYRPESLDWRLFIATPLVDQKGPASAYADIQDALRTLGTPLWISMQDISVVSPNDKLVRVIKKGVHIPSGVNGVRLTRTRVDDTYIEDAYVYRLKPKWAYTVFGGVSDT